MFALGLAIGAGGCSQTTQVATTEAAITGPLVLDSAPGANPTPLDSAAVETAPAPVAAAPTPAPAPVAAAPAPAPAAAQPVQPTALQTEPMPTTAAGPTAEEGQFPNINKPPAQPGGTLLPEATRAQIIADLEKLRAGQQSAGGGGGGSATDLATQAQTHGQAAIQRIEECSAEGALQNNPACAPAD